MRLRQLVQDDDAVSPVIGVILMVAITVILAAVIASFVLGLGDQAQQTTPQASFSFDYEDGASGGDFGGDLTGSPDGVLTITHDGGDTIDGARLTLSDGEAESDTFDTSSGGPDIDEVTAGTSVDVDIEETDTIRVIFSGESGDSSSTLATYDAPEA